MAKSKHHSRKRRHTRKHSRKHRGGASEENLLKKNISNKKNKNNYEKKIEKEIDKYRKEYRRFVNERLQKGIYTFAPAPGPGPSDEEKRKILRVIRNLRSKARRVALTREESILLKNLEDEYILRLGGSLLNF